MEFLWFQSHWRTACWISPFLRSQEAHVKSLSIHVIKNKLFLCNIITRRPTNRSAAAASGNGQTPGNNGLGSVGIADDQAKDFDFEKTEMKYDSTGMVNHFKYQTILGRLWVFVYLKSPAFKMSWFDSKLGFYYAVSLVSSSVHWRMHSGP